MTDKIHAFAGDELPDIQDIHIALDFSLLHSGAALARRIFRAPAFTLPRTSAS